MIAPFSLRHASEPLPLALFEVGAACGTCVGSGGDGGTDTGWVKGVSRRVYFDQPPTVLMYPYSVPPECEDYDALFMLVSASSVILQM